MLSSHEEDRGNDLLFSREEDRQANSYAPTSRQVTKENERDDVDHLAQNEKSLYPARVNNMRMQFAWAAVILAFSWIYAIIFVILSHGVGLLHIHPFLRVAWGMGGTLTAAIVAYCACMLWHAHLQHRGEQNTERRNAALFWRQAASPISFSVASVVGMLVFIFSPIWICNHTQYEFEGLSDSVLVTLITSTTVSVLGILGSVMWWLFPRIHEDK